MVRCWGEKWRGRSGVGGFGGGVFVGVENHEGLKDGADLAEDGEGGFVEDSGTKVVVEVVAESFEERAAVMKRSQLEGRGGERVRMKRTDCRRSSPVEKNCPKRLNSSEQSCLRYPHPALV